MNRFKNNETISAVKELLGELQGIYTKRDVDSLEKFIDERFLFDSRSVFVGKELNDWCFEGNAVKELVKAQVQEEDNLLKEFNFKFEEAKIFGDEKAAWVISIGEIKNKISSEEMCNMILEEVKDVFTSEESSKRDILDKLAVMAKGMRRIHDGEDYRWPFRFTTFMVKEEEQWKFHQMQFSFDTDDYNFRMDDENFDKGSFDIQNKGISEEQEEVRGVLRKFQKGYEDRNLENVDQYMEELFLNSDEVVVVGTDAEELCLGFGEAKEIVESDWQWWGDFRFNQEEALVNVVGDIAYFTTKANMTRVVDEKTLKEWGRDYFKYYYEGEDPVETKCYDIIEGWCSQLELMETRDTIILPMKFSGVMIKKDGRWLIQHLQFAEYLQGIPQVRTVE